MPSFGFAEDQQHGVLGQITENTLFWPKTPNHQKMTFCTTYHHHIMAFLIVQATSFKMSPGVSFCLAGTLNSLNKALFGLWPITYMYQAFSTRCVAQLYNVYGSKGSYDSFGNFRLTFLQPQTNNEQSKVIINATFNHGVMEFLTDFREKGAVHTRYIIHQIWSLLLCICPFRYTVTVSLSVILLRYDKGISCCHTAILGHHQRPQEMSFEVKTWYKYVLLITIGHKENDRK